MTATTANPADTTARSANSISRATSFRRILRRSSLAVLAATGLALTAASAAHALPDAATLTITDGWHSPAAVYGQFGTETVTGAKNLAAATTVRIEWWGDDSINDDYLGVAQDYEMTPTTAAIPFQTSSNTYACHEGLDEDNYPGNRTDEIYARIFLIDGNGKRIRSLRTNNVSFYDYSNVFGVCWSA